MDEKRRSDIAMSIPFLKNAFMRFYLLCVKEGGQKMSKKYAFPDIHQLINHIIFKSNRKMTPLRLQKTLYFMFAFYGATYGQYNENNDEYIDQGGGLIYPELLFEETFEAWQYGPVIKSIYFEYKYNADEIKGKEFIPEKGNEVQANMLELLENVLRETDSMGDFTLVERSHEDESWAKAYEISNGTKIIPEDIVKDYLSRAI